MEFETVQQVKDYLTNIGAKGSWSNDEVQDRSQFDLSKMSFAYGFTFGGIHRKTGLELTDFSTFVISGEPMRFYWSR